MIQRSLAEVSFSREIRCTLACSPVNPRCSLWISCTESLFFEMSQTWLPGSLMNMESNLGNELIMIRLSWANETGTIINLVKYDAWKKINFVLLFYIDNQDIKIWEVENHSDINQMKIIIIFKKRIYFLQFYIPCLITNFYN